MHRFWFEFESGEALPPDLAYGCGVTAIDKTDALKLLQHAVFRGDLPSVRKVVEDVDVRDLDQGHVIPNMNAPDRRGIWFPGGYQ